MGRRGLTPRLVQELHAAGFEATCSRDRDRLRDSDARLLARCLVEDRILVSANAGDFRALVGACEAHPGLVILPGEASAQRQRALMRAALAHIAAGAETDGVPPRDWMLNRVVEVTIDADAADYELPAREQ